MPGYRFALQKLLDLRARAEDEARCEFAASQRETDRAQAALTACREAWEARAATAPAGRLEPGAALNQALHLTGLQARARDHVQQVARCTTAETERREQLLARARDHQALDQLREQRWQQYLQARERAQQRSLDEAGTMAHVARRTAS